MGEFNPRKRRTLSSDNVGELAEGSRQHAHTFIVRVIKVPSEFINLRPRWRGEYQHLYRGENIGRKRFLLKQFSRRYASCDAD